MREVAPFRILSETERRRLPALIESHLTGWGETWFSVPPEPGFEVFPESAHSSMEEENWYQLAIDSDRWIAWSANDGAWRDYARLLMGDAVEPSVKPSPLLKALLQECFQDLANRFLSLTGADVSLGRAGSGHLTECAVGYGSGAIVGFLSAGYPLQTLAMSGAVVEALLGPKGEHIAPIAELVPRKSAVGSAKAYLEIVLGDTEINLAELATLAAGDVIRVQSPYRLPIIARSPDGKALLKVHLGALGARKAIQVIGKEN